MYVLIDGELYHHGVKGQRWGVRRYQNPDGSLTPLGKKRQLKRIAKDFNSQAKRDGGDRRNAIRVLSKSDTITDLYAHEELRAARKKLQALDKEFDDYYRDPKTLSKFQKIRAKELTKEYPYDESETLRWVKYDDSKQNGHYTSVETYFRSKGRDFNAEHRQAFSDMMSVSEKLTKAYVEEYGHIRVKDLTGTYDVEELIGNALKLRYAYEQVGYPDGR